MDFDPRFKHPFSAIVSGPSQAGKTEFVAKFVKYASQLMTVPPGRIYWHYMEYQPGYESLRTIANLELVEGLPDVERLKGDEGSKLVILDDMMMEIAKNATLTTLFTRGVHHWNMSVVHIVQNTFYANMRNARINASYLVLYKSPSDKLQIANLARQLYPGKNRFFMDAFEDATSVAYGYLVVDLTQTTPDNLRLRTQIFPSEQLLVYLHKV